MPSYAALLGHQPALSIAELAARLPDLTPGHLFDHQYFVFETSAELGQDFLSTLGGTVMLAKKVDMPIAKDLSNLPNLLVSEVMNIRGKVTFGLRFCGVNPAKGHELLRACKKLLKKDHNMSSRYIGNEREPAKAIQLHDEGMLNRKEGCELTVLVEKDTHWIGRTVGAQDVKGYTQRDIGKPVRDTTVGLLPPKLAQILLNFGWFLATGGNATATLKDCTVLDPFCGTGVIPLEAMLRGWHVLASDVEIKAKNGCTKNVEWMRKTYDIFKKDVDVTVWKHDALEPFDLATMPTMIVTEGTLGRTLKDRPTLKQTDLFVKKLETLEEKFLLNCKATLPTVPIVMTWPVWYSSKRPVFLDAMPDLARKAGYQLVLPPHTKPSYEGRFSLVYRRPDQFVGREIVLLQPRK